VINTLKAQPGDSIVVFGTGSVGLSALMARKGQRMHDHHRRGRCGREA
jgi:Zn-dependent alcohol dehydrogenase